MKPLFKVLAASVATLSITAAPLANLPYSSQAQAAQAQTVSTQQQAQLIGKDRFQFTRNSNIFYVNGVASTSDENVAVVKGATYVQLKSIATAYGFKLSYNSATKESVAAYGNLKISFKQNESTMKVNGKSVKTGGKVFSQNGNLMVPLRAWADATGSTLQANGIHLSLSWNTQPKAVFTVNEKQIIAGETTVTTKDQASSSLGFKIVEEKWEGLEKVYSEPGQYTISRSVKDSRGIWSEPYQLTITVEKPNTPPVAEFTTEKTTYKIGEPVYYTNKSHDDGKIVRNTWTGNEPAFFKAGTYTIKLEVQDDRGATSQIEKQITVTDEVMYTKEQFYLNFASQGDIIPIDSSFSLSVPTVTYGIESEDMTAVRTNSPEQLQGPAIDYSDSIAGAVRFNIHKQNISDKPLELHLVATNEGDTATTVSKNRFSFAGPATYVSQSGKTAASRFLEELLAPLEPESITLQPGESVELITGVPAISAGKTLTIFGEYYSPSPIRYTLVVTEKNGDGIASLDTLTQSEHDGKHIRGTFSGGNREIIVDKLLGETGAEKLVLGDKTQVYDKLLTGVDAVTGEEIINYGNGGTVYNMTFNIAPHTAVLLNPRGGHYGGAFIVNEKIVQITNNSILKGQEEAAFLYRSGNFQESISISYVVAPGSNMPLHLLFVPVPSLNAEEDNATATNEAEQQEQAEQTANQEQAVGQEQTQQ